MLYIKRYIIGLSLLGLVFFLPTSCIKENLEFCPPPASGKLWIEPSFTMHNQKDDNGQYKELFTETTQRIDLFFFDAETGLLQKSIYDSEVPASGTYRLPVDLPAGRYVAKAWANLYANKATAIYPSIPQPHVTHLKEMEIYLSESAGAGKSLITLHPTSQLWGTTGIFEVASTGYKQDSVIPAKFIRNTNLIDFSIRWHDKDKKKLCPLWAHADSTRIYIDDANSTYALKDNSIVAADSITYIPVYLTGAMAEKAFMEEDIEAAATLEARFTVMRLLTDTNPIIRITRLQPDGSEREVYRKQLMKDFISQRYTKQEELDREERFVIELDFDCQHSSNNDQDSWIAIRIAINGWVLIDNGDIGLGK
jgi:hypothetical protein